MTMATVTGEVEMNFTNQVCGCEPETTLFPQEIDVMLEVVRAVIVRFAPKARQGTFILDGQPNGQEAYCILRFNLADGKFERRFYRATGKNSDELAEESIDELLAIPEDSCYTRGDSKLRRELREQIAAAGVQAGVWHDKDLHVLVLNTTHGRFLTSCFIRPVGGPAQGIAAELDAPDAVMYAVAQTLAWLCPEDEVLQESLSIIADEAHERNKRPYDKVEDIVEALFVDGAVPAIRDWKTWREAEADKLTLFFE